MNDFPDRDWNLTNADGKTLSWDKVPIAVLMDIRRELRRLNATLACSNFLSIPRSLRAIKANTERKKKAVKS